MFQKKKVYRRKWEVIEQKYNKNIGVHPGLQKLQCKSSQQDFSECFRTKVIQKKMGGNLEQKYNARIDVLLWLFKLPEHQDWTKVLEWMLA